MSSEQKTHFVQNTYIDKAGYPLNFSVFTVKFVRFGRQSNSCRAIPTNGIAKFDFYLPHVVISPDEIWGCYCKSFTGYYLP